MTSGGGARPDTPPLRGRDVEQGTVNRRLHWLTEGRGGVVVVEGAPGSGKSRLLAEATAGGRRRGSQVLAGAGQLATLGIPAWLLLDMLTDPTEPLVDIDAVGRAAGRPESG